MTTPDLPDNIIHYKPSAFYWRHNLRRARTKAAAIRLGLRLVTELEKHKEFIRELGLVPPKWAIPRDEMLEKRWGEELAFETGAPRPPHQEVGVLISFADEVAKMQAEQERQRLAQTEKPPAV